MKIVVDENIPFAQEAFGRLGEVLALSGRAISCEMIQDATILVVRSVTPVNAALLQGSAVQFVGTATAGCDHIDQDYLRHNKILFASAAGSNANSVAEYVISALFLRASKRREVLRGKTLGIIGVGHVGSLLKLKAEAIGMIPILNDPPLQRESGKSEYRSLQETCEADFISLHVPLNDVGEDSTRNLLNEDRLRRINPKTVIINTARGEVIDPVPFLNQLEKKQLARPILDVWSNEPSINWALLEKVEIGTPHIAGYSLDGKVAGVQMVYESACAALGVMPSWSRHGLT
ncbi:MAG: 4-phosphoerythronate dehydrogenase, partial [Nitrospirae bacterium]|nr:4-phosphoerythronate dehydrogenase [Candidatus Manganitrophaceae bacterium]